VLLGCVHVVGSNLQLGQTCAKSATNRKWPTRAKEHQTRKYKSLLITWRDRGQHRYIITPACIHVERANRLSHSLSLFISAVLFIIKAPVIIFLVFCCHHGPLKRHRAPASVYIISPQNMYINRLSFLYLLPKVHSFFIYLDLII
jgi:hypothetical protein